MPHYTPQELLAHRGHMILIDEIHCWGEEWLESFVYHTHQSLFANAHGHIPSWVSLEYMCQSIAALEGINRLTKGKPITLGFVMGSKKLETFTPYFQQGEHVKVYVEEVMRSENSLGVYDCKVFSTSSSQTNHVAPNDDQGLLAKARIKAIMPDDPSIIFSAKAKL